MDQPSLSPEENCRPTQTSDDRPDQVAVPEAQCDAAQQQIFQKPNRRRPGRPWKYKRGTVWSIVCAMNLGLFSESSLKDVSFVNFGDGLMKKLYRTEEMAADLETSDREDKPTSDREDKPTSDLEAKPTNNSSAVWPFMQMQRTVTLKKAVRKRGKRRRGRWTIKRQNKQKDLCRRWIDSKDRKSAMKRRVVVAGTGTTSALSFDTHSRTFPNTDRRDTPDGSSARLLACNFSFRQFHARLPTGSNPDEARDSLSTAHRATGEDEAREKPTRESNRATETPADHSASRRAGFRTLIHNRGRAKRGRASLSKRTDYYKNVARVNDDIGDIWENTTSDSDENDKNDKNDEDNEDKNLKDRLVLLKNRKVIKQWQPTNRRHQQNSAATNNRDARVITHDNRQENRQENLTKRVVSSPKIDLVKKTQKLCDCNHPRRRSYNNTTSCSCKENLKNTATAILKDIRAQICNTDTDQSTEDVEITEDPDKSRDEHLDHEVFKYEWEDEGAPDYKNNSLQSAVSSVKPVPKMYTNRKPRGRRGWQRTGIDCKYIDRTETTYQNVLPEHVDLDDSTSSTPSLKINVDEMNWDSKDCGISAMVEPRSSLIEGCGNEDEDMLDTLTAVDQVVFDDDADDETHQERNVLMASACYVYRETPNNTDETAVNVAKAPEARLRAKPTNLRDPKDVITYGNRKKSNGKSLSTDRSFGQEKSQDSTKVQVRSTTDGNKDNKNNKNNKDNKDNKDNDSDYEIEKKYVLRRSTRSSNSKETKESNVGKLIWGNCSGWWPALIVEADQVGMAPEPNKMWVYWIGESQISLLNEKTQIEPFSRKLEERLTQKFRKNNTRSQAIDETIKMLRQRYECTLTKPYYYWIRRNIKPEELDNLCFYPYSTNIQERLDALKEQNAKATEQYISKQRNGSPEPKKQLVEKTKDTKAVKQMEDERLPLREQMPGVITWAKITGHNWWPAMIIDYRDCCLKEPGFGCQWIMWYGDYTVSQVHHLAFLKFHKGIEKMREYIENTKKHVYLVGVLQASKDYCSRLGCNTDNWSLDNVFKYFSDMNNIHVPYNHLQVSESNKVYDKYSNEIVKKINELKSNTNVDSKRKDDIDESDDLRRVMLEQSKLKKLCLKCLKFHKNAMEDHPFFEGSLCKECSNLFKPCMFVFGNDDKCFYCTVCAATGTVVICDREDCPRVYCTACLKYLLCPKVYNEMLLEDPWECFLCRDKSTLPAGLLRPRPNWKEKFSRMFCTTSDPISNNINIVNNNEKKKGIRVLSLFDGLSTGLVVLLKLGITVDVYYASEIDQNALTISSAHFGDRITYLGDVRDVTKEKVKEMMPIDLLIGGSPCNDLSLVNPARLGLYNPKGTGILFFEYIRILNQLKRNNKGRHLFWLYENVASMPSEFRLEMNKHLGQEPTVVDSADFSPQHRLRLYWHNLPDNPYFPQFQKQQDVQDILTPNCNRYALVKKIRTVTTRTNSLRQGKAELKPIMMKGTSDTLWITELEEIFGFPRHYTDVKNLSATNRQRLIGKSWSVQTLTAILRPLCSFYKCNEDENSPSDSR